MRHDLVTQITSPVRYVNSLQSRFLFSSKKSLFYQQYMKASLQAAAISTGKPEQGSGGSHDSGQYNQFPEDTGFFKRDGTWDTEYGQFFLSWYSGLLQEHGDKILDAAKGVFQGTGAKLSGKIAGIHWHYKTRSHPAELTAGYITTLGTAMVTQPWPKCSPNTESY